MAHVVNRSAPQWSVYVQRLTSGEVVLHIGRSPGARGRDVGGLLLSQQEADQVASLLEGASA